MVKLETQHLKDANEQHINSAVFILQERRLTMPETKFQDFIYTLIMAFLMVYVMICYNISFILED